VAAGRGRVERRRPVATGDGNGEGLEAQAPATTTFAAPKRLALRSKCAAGRHVLPLPQASMVAAIGAFFGGLFA
jgi:hypothetical protein